MRYGTSLVLQNIVRDVAKVDFIRQILCGGVLELLKGDSRWTSWAAQDKFGDDINIDKKLIVAENEKKNFGSIAELYGESVFHVLEQIEGAGLRYQGIYVDLHEDFPGVKVKKL